MTIATTQLPITNFNGQRRLRSRPWKSKVGKLNDDGYYPDLTSPSPLCAGWAASLLANACVVQQPKSTRHQRPPEYQQRPERFADFSSWREKSAQGRRLGGACADRRAACVLSVAPLLAEVRRGPSFLGILMRKPKNGSPKRDQKAFVRIDETAYPRFENVSRVTEM